MQRLFGAPSPDLAEGLEGGGFFEVGEGVGEMNGGDAAGVGSVVGLQPGGGDGFGGIGLMEGGGLFRGEFGGGQRGDIPTALPGAVEVGGAGLGEVIEGGLAGGGAFGPEEEAEVFAGGNEAPLEVDERAGDFAFDAGAGVGHEVLKRAGLEGVRGPVDGAREGVGGGFDLREGEEAAGGGLVAGGVGGIGIGGPAADIGFRDGDGGGEVGEFFEFGLEDLAAERGAGFPRCFGEAFALDGGEVDAATSEGGGVWHGAGGIALESGFEEAEGVDGSAGRGVEPGTAPGGGEGGVESGSGGVGEAVGEEVGGDGGGLEVEGAEGMGSWELVSEEPGGLVLGEAGAGGGRGGLAVAAEVEGGGEGGPGGGFGEGLAGEHDGDLIGVSLDEPGGGGALLGGGEDQAGVDDDASGAWVEEGGRLGEPVGDADIAGGDVEPLESGGESAGGPGGVRGLGWAGFALAVPAVEHEGVAGLGDDGTEDGAVEGGGGDEGEAADAVEFGGDSLIGD